MPRPSPGRTPWARLAALVLVLVLPLAPPAPRAPTRRPRPTASAAATTTSPLASHPVQTKTRIHRVVGRLPDARRKAVRTSGRRGRRPLVGGRLPRRHLPAQQLPRGVPRLHRRAPRSAPASDKALLTNQTGGHRIDAVEAKHRAVTLDILATGKQARSVTAHFALRFDTRGDKTGTTTVRGRLFLARKQGAWRIFGYDVAKGAR